MRIFINMADQTGSNKTTRLSITNCSDTTQFTRQICRQLKINKNSSIISIKSDGINLRITDGWPLSLYKIKNGSWIMLQENQLMNCNSPISSSTTLQKIDENEQQFELLNSSNNQLKEEVSFLSSQQKSLNLQDYGDYFDKQLSKMLSFVRQNKLEEVAQLLKEDPQIKENNQAYRAIILCKKNQYLLNQLGQCGRNALHWAIHCQNVEIVTFLLIKCCDPTIQTIDQYTPLQLAVIHRNLQIVTLLVNQPKVDVNKLTTHGTALHLASYHHSINLIKLLLQHAANPEIKNKQNQIPIDLTEIKQIKQLFIENENIKKLRFLRPNISKGNINLISSVTYRIKPRSLQINPFKNQILVYKDKEVQSKVKISSVYQVTKIQQKSWLMKSDLHYFKVSYQYQQIQSKYLFGLSHKEMRNKWIQCLNNCVQYVKNSKYVTKIQVQDQLIQILDDTKNQVKIHKRQTKQEGVKTPQNKFKYSIFDLKFKQDVIQTPKKPERKFSQQFISNNHNQNYQFSMIANLEEAQNFRSSQIFLGSIIGQAILSSPNQQRKTLSSLQTNQKSEQSTNQISYQISPVNFRKTVSQPVINEFKLQEKKKISYADFDFVRQLGSGSFGKVFLAQKKSDKKVYAMKILNKKKLMAKKQLKYAVSQTNILKKISHPFIVTLHYSFQTPSNLYIALDYCPKGDLSQLLCQKQKLQQSTARFIIAQLILTIDYLHSQKIIYRDLKPENVLICEDGYIKLIDFGLSKQNNFAMSFCGSPAYLSPEMLDKKGHGFSTDIYGIGCVLYQMVIGQPPFFDQNIDQLFQNIKNARLKFPGYLTKQIKSLISMLLQRDINKRIGVNSIAQLKRHQFFKGFSWEKLIKKVMSAPKQILQQQFEDQYLKLQQNVKSQQVFSDQDYANSSIMLNRIKNFTFCRQQFQQKDNKNQPIK